MRLLISKSRELTRDKPQQQSRQCVIPLPVPMVGRQGGVDFAGVQVRLNTTTRTPAPRTGAYATKTDRITGMLNERPSTKQTNGVTMNHAEPPQVRQEVEAERVVHGRGKGEDG